MGGSDVRIRWEGLMRGYDCMVGFAGTVGG